MDATSSITVLKIVRMMGPTTALLTLAGFIVVIVLFVRAKKGSPTASFRLGLVAHFLTLFAVIEFALVVVANSQQWLERIISNEVPVEGHHEIMTAMTIHVSQQTLFIIPPLGVALLAVLARFIVGPGATVVGVSAASEREPID